MVFEVQGFLRMLHSKSIMVTSGWPWSSPNFPLDIIYNPGCHLSDFFHASLIVNLEIYGLLLLLLSLQSCPTLCDPIDGSPPGSPIPGILQARILEWVAISFSSARKWKVKVKLFSRFQLLAPHGLQPTRFLCPWDFPGKSTGVGCHCLLRMYGLPIFNHSFFFSKIKTGNSRI